MVGFKKVFPSLDDRKSLFIKPSQHAANVLGSSLTQIDKTC